MEYYSLVTWPFRDRAKVRTLVCRWPKEAPRPFPVLKSSPIGGGAKSAPKLTRAHERSASRQMGARGEALAIPKMLPVVEVEPTPWTHV